MVAPIMRFDKLERIKTLVELVEMDKSRAPEKHPSTGSGSDIILARRKLLNITESLI